MSDDFKRCPNCSTLMDRTSDIMSHRHGRVRFESWLCPSCGVRQETRQLGTEPEETLLVSPPRAQVDAALQDRMEQERLGHEEFQSIGGKRRVERKHP